MKKNKYLKYLINDEYEEDLPITEIEPQVLKNDKDEIKINQNINSEENNSKDKNEIIPDKECSEKKNNFIDLQRQERSLNLQLLNSKINNMSIINMSDDDDDFIEDDFEYINETNSTDSDE
jgi:hypothetical protein